MYRMIVKMVDEAEDQKMEWDGEDEREVKYGKWINKKMKVSGLMKRWIGEEDGVEKKTEWRNKKEMEDRWE